MAKGWQSDQRFVCAMVAERYRRGFGPLLTLAKLQALGIEVGLIQVELIKPDYSWQNSAIDLVKRRFGGRAVPWIKKARFLQSRGFSSEHIVQACGCESDAE